MVCQQTAILRKNECAILGKVWLYCHSMNAAGKTNQRLWEQAEGTHKYNKTKY